jgi:hypothetical protein
LSPALRSARGEGELLGEARGVGRGSLWRFEGEEMLGLPAFRRRAAAVMAAIGKEGVVPGLGEEEGEG